VRIRAVNRKLSAIDVARDGTDQPKIFVLIKAAERSGKQNQQNATAIAEDEHFKITA
jgi:hypothetical protein